MSNEFYRYTNLLILQDILNKKSVVMLLFSTFIIKLFLILHLIQLKVLRYSLLF